MRQTNIVIVENDPGLIKLIKNNLSSNYYGTLVATNGDEAMKLIENEEPDLAIINYELNDMHGLELCRRLRKWSKIPIIILGSNCDAKWKTESLNAGADDHISVPFDIEEMLAHIKAILRRIGKLGYTEAQSSFYIGDIEIRFNERRVLVADREIQLTPTEYNLLQELALNPNKVLTHILLLHKIWGPEFGQEREYLRIFVGKLRKKLEADPKNPNYIVTVPWVGYTLRQNNQCGDVKLPVIA